MKKKILIFTLFMLVIPFKVDALVGGELATASHGEKTMYIKTIKSNLDRVQDVEIEMTKEDYEAELAESRTIQTREISSTTEYKTMHFSYSLVSGTTYKLTSYINWNTMPGHRLNDFMVFTYSNSGTTGSTYNQYQKYKNNGTYYTTSTYSHATLDKVSAMGVPFTYAPLNSSYTTISGKGAYFDLVDTASITVLQTHFSMNVTGLNTSTRFCVINKHQDTNGEALIGLTAIYLNSNNGGTKHEIFVGHRNITYNYFDSLYSKHTLCFN